MTDHTVVVKDGTLWVKAKERLPHDGINDVEWVLMKAKLYLFAALMGSDSFIDPELREYPNYSVRLKISNDSSSGIIVEDGIRPVLSAYKRDKKIFISELAVSSEEWDSLMVFLEKSGLIRKEDLDVFLID